MGSRPIVGGRSPRRFIKSLVGHMDRSCTEYKSLGRLAHTLTSAPNLSSLVTDRLTDTVTASNPTSVFSHLSRNQSYVIFSRFVGRLRV